MKITKTEKVKMSWDSFTFPITVGTPVSNGGVLADSASAYGLIVRTIFAKPDADETAEIMTGGVIDMEEVSAGYGKELSSEAVQALCGIHFYKEGVCIPTGGSGGGGSDDQKWHETTTTQFFSETVTTSTGEFGNEAELAYSSLIDADTLIVTFNGTEYVCPRINLNGMIAYGGIGADGPDFSEYPFAIARIEDKNMVFVENPGTYTVSASAENTTYTDAFKEGVTANVVKEVSNISEADVVLVDFTQRVLTSVSTVNVAGDSNQATVSIHENVYEHLLIGEYLFYRNTASSFSCNELTLYEDASELHIQIQPPVTLAVNNGVYTFDISGIADIVLDDSNSLIKYYKLGFPRLSSGN